MNRTIFKIICLILCTIAVVACKDDSLNTGSSILSEEERIIVGRDTFSTHSELTLGRDIYTTPDSFLLGESDSRFGIIHADILAQFTCPLGFQFPDNAEVDSVCLFFYYNSWYGDGRTPMSLAVYEMDKKTFDYSTPYSHTIDAEEYATVAPDNNILLRQRFLTAARPTDSVYNSSTNKYVPYVRMRLTDDFASRLFAARDFSSLDAFTQQFKGLYIKSDFGSATLLHVTDVNLALYYHFTYNKAGRDTTVNDVKGYFANSEVRQVNRYTFLNPTLDELDDDSTINYVVSPAGMYTRLSLPLRQMAQNISDRMAYTTPQGDTKYRRPYINKAGVTIEVLNADEPLKPTRDDWAHPAPTMMLIKESAIDRFFTKQELPSDTCALLTSLQYGVDSLDNITGYYYYDLVDLLTQSIRDVEKDPTNVPEQLDMLLVPVSVGSGSSSTAMGNSYYYGYGSSSSSTVSSVKHEQVVTATVLRSAQDPNHPITIEVVYSGF